MPVGLDTDDVDEIKDMALHQAGISEVDPVENDGTFQKSHFTAPLSIVVPRTRHPEYEDEADKQNQQTHHFRLFQNGTL
jgi:hypothetical protein